MKIRSSILVFIIVAVAAIALLLWYGKKQPVETSPLASVETNVAPRVVTVPSQPVSTPVHAAPSPANPNANTVAVSPPSQMEKAVGILSTYNDVPIDFYGRLEDQYSNAVAGAAVNFSVRIMNGHEFSSKDGQVASDADGFFTISGYKGQDLNVVPQRAGYVLATPSTLFKYSHLEDHPFTADPNNRTVIRMWKLQGAEPLVSINQTYKLPYTALPMRFDLLTTQIVPIGGDLIIIVARPEGVISGRNPQEWSIFLEIVDGGFIETSPEESITTFVAPENGYQPSGNFGRNNGPDLVDRSLFIKSRNGQVYSKLHLLFGINDTPGGFMNITFSGVANTNSSPNWEGSIPQGQ